MRAAPVSEALPRLSGLEGLAELTDADVTRIRKTNETPPRISVYDVLRCVSGTHQKATFLVLDRLREQYPEVHTLCMNFKFPGPGQRETPVTCARGIVRIIMLLPCRAAAPVRAKAADVLVRYLGGDPSLVAEISENRVEREKLPQSHAVRIFGDAVGISDPATATTNLHTSHEELAKRLCETVLRQVSRTVLDVFAEKFQELATRMMVAQNEWQIKALASLREIRRPEAAPAATERAGQEVIDVDECAPTAASDGRGRSQIKVSDFMRANWKDEWAGVNVKSYLLKFSLLLKSKARRTASGPLAKSKARFRTAHAES